MAKSRDNGETVAGYFRKVFAENPGWLEGRSNQALLDRWLADHPGEREVPEAVKKNMQNVKGILRQQLRKKKRGRPRKVEVAAPNEVAVNAQPSVATPEPAGPSPLEQLEERIDGCMMAARRIDPEGLNEVTGLLRRARNAVVWLQGE